MPRVMIRCPFKKTLVSTGVVMNKASFENPAVVLNNYVVHCPACGRDHTWSKEYAILEETKPA